MNRVAMDESIVKGLINSVSRLIHLAACQTITSSDLKGIQTVIRILKLLKPVLDEIVGIELPADKQLTSAFEELDIAVNWCREFLEKRSRKFSKIRNVLQSELMVLKVRESSKEICHALNALPLSSSFAPQSVLIQDCMQELQCIERNLPSDLTDVILKDKWENVTHSVDDTINIMINLGLASTQEVLMENIALEKERIKAELEKNTEELDNTTKIIALITHIRFCMAKLERFGFINGVRVPSYFRCPLSLELMIDPVIVASGQTYERYYIQKWLDHGLKICPQTRQILTHINLTPNFTVKALISNWCKDNNIRLGDSVEPDIMLTPFLSSVCLKDISCSTDIHGSVPRDTDSRSSVDCMDQSEHQKSEISFGCAGENSSVVTHQMVIEQLISEGSITGEQQSCTHSRSESISSVISSTDISSKFDEQVCLLEVSHSLSSSSNKHTGTSPWLSLNDHRDSQNGQNNNNTSLSLVPFIISDDLTTTSHVNKLIEDLKCRSPELQLAATSGLRLLAKHNMDNRILIAKCGAISPLISLMTSKVKIIQENSVTALLNLSINDDNKISIARAGAIEPLIHVLKSGSMEAQENSAATLFSLSVLEENRAKIGRSGAVKALINLLGYGSLRGRKDAAAALFNLSILYENKARIIQAGAVKYLVELMDPSTGMVDKSVALLANLSTIPEGRTAIAHEGGIPLLVEIVDTGTRRGKENAASALFQLCINSPKFCSLVLQEGAVPPLVALSQFGTPRAKEKAQQILGHFRSQREGNTRKPKV